MKLIIDEEFKSYLPELADDELKTLEKSILEHGCQTPLTVWGDILIDGHNRLKICNKHNIEYNTSQIEFATREDALVYMLQVQLGRRNLTPQWISYYRGKQYELEKYEISNAMGRNQHSEVGGQNDPQPREKTAVRLAKEHSVAPKTIKRDAKVATVIDRISEVSQEAKQKILSGQGGIRKKSLEKLVKASDEVIAETARQIERGVIKPVEAKTDPETGIGWTRDDTRDFTWHIEDVLRDINSIADTFIQQIRYSLKDHSTIIHEPGNKEKVIAALEQTEAAIKKTKGLLS